MRSIEIIEPTERDNEEYTKIMPVSRLYDWVPFDTRFTNYIQCNCMFGDVCPNNPSKRLVGMFPLCHILVPNKT